VICTRFLIVLTLLVLLRAAGAAGAPAITPEQEKFFEDRIRPVLADQCLKCHGADAAKVKGDLLLTSREGLLKGGASKQPAVVPGEPDKSLLIRAIKYEHPDVKMPPKARLTPEQVEHFVAWVRMGAPDPRVAGAVSLAPKAPTPAEAAKSHWSFLPVKDAPAPQVKNGAWVRNDIDRFILAKLEQKNLPPAAPADKVTLLRRSTFDLTGLPPTPEQVDAFLADESPDAFAKVVDGLLASPHYGERWGRHWLDVVRYADTAGDSSDYPVPQAHLYRNWVINAFNADKPYDQFLKEQIAGDLLPASGDDDRNQKLIATGYLATARRFSVRPESLMHQTIEDTIDVVSKSTLGLTLGCSRCHDHKYDPLPQADYYALYGVFASTRYPFAGSENDQYQKDFVPLAGHAETADKEAKEVAGKRAALEAELKQIREKFRDRDKLSGEERQRLRDESRKKSRELGELVKRGVSVPTAYAVVDDDEPADAQIHQRGEPGRRGETVRRGFLQVLGGQKLPEGHKGSGRLELAGWITDRSNPLTARVMVNRIWQHHFGEGIVRTPSDFGARGQRPTHPELLDWLAVRFGESKYSVKAMHRLVMLSAAYQASSKADTALASADPNNELFGRFTRRRLEAEAIRDSVLAVSGDLDRAVTPGPHPFPPMKQWNFTQHNAFSAVYPTRQRSVYLMTQRIKKHPFLEVFDGADGNISTGQRTSSTTPIQALLMMNDPFVHEQAEKFAARLLSSAGDDAGKLELAYRLALSRKPTAEEITAATGYLKTARERLKSAGTAADQVDRAAFAGVARVLMASNEFVYVE